MPNWDAPSSSLSDVRARLEGLLPLDESVGTTEPTKQAPPKLSPIAQKILAWLRRNKADGTWLKYKGKSGRDGNFINFLSDLGADWKIRDSAIQELLISEIVELDDDKGMRLIEEPSGRV